jgi:hypothetical protein
LLKLLPSRLLALTKDWYVAHDTVAEIRTGLRVLKAPAGLAWGRHDAAISSIAVGLVTGQGARTPLSHLLVYTQQQQHVKHAVDLRQICCTPWSISPQISKGVSPNASPRWPPSTPHPSNNWTTPACCCAGGQVKTQSLIGFSLDQVSSAHR